MRLKGFIPLVFCLFLCVTTSVSANELGIQNNVFFELKRFELTNDSIYIDMDLYINELNLSTTKVVEFTPTIQRLEEIKSLPKISVMGNTSYKVFNRTLALMSKEKRADFATSMPYEIIKGNHLKNIACRYKMQIPFEKWMENACLMVKTDFCGCGDQSDGFVYVLDVLQESNDSLELACQDSINLDVEDTLIVKDQQEKLVFYYTLGDSTLDLNLAENKREYEQLENILKDKNREILKINISGYASPEGLFSFNQELSMARALAFKNYMQNQNASMNIDICEIHAKGENWIDLESMISDSDLDTKAEVLNILKHTPITNGRELKLMQFQNGRTYIYMQKEMFPLLRKVEVLIDCKVECRKNEY